MFEQIKPTNQTTAPVEDMFSTSDQLKTPTNPTPPPGPMPVRPIPTMSTPIGSPRFGEAGPVQPLTSLKDIQETPKKSGKPWMMIIIILLLVIFLALAYLVYAKFFMTPAENVQNNLNNAKININTNNANNNSNQNTNNSNLNQNVNENQNLNNNNLNTRIDTDKDGITDQEEQNLGTNINVVDTDGDLLTDFEEIRIYKTNPILSDSDGDGYKDGDEVKNGYNPLGTGKLPALQIPPINTNTNTNTNININI